MHERGFRRQRVETLVSGGAYNAASQLTDASYNIGGAYNEVRAYNDIGQMTAMSFPGVFAEEYNFTAGANNGRVQSIVTWYWNSVETTTFGYDSLNRLSSATGQGWSQGFQMDGFGNLTGVTGSASASLPVDPATNRLTVPCVTYDANGNQTKSLAGLTLNYDIENRITTNPANGNPFAYDSTNRRILDGTLDGKVWVFWAIDGSMSGRYQGSASGGSWSFTTLEVKADLTGRLTAEGVPSGGGWSWIRVVTDRLGSVRVRGAQKLDYYPYGQQRPGEVGPFDKTKFGTYTRDAGTDVDYANQRFYGYTAGRFASADPVQAQNALVLPGNWNRYAFVGLDAINKTDPWGLCSPEDDPPCYSVTGTGNLPGPPPPGPTGVGGGGAGGGQGGAGPLVDPGNPEVRPPHPYSLDDCLNEVEANRQAEIGILGPRPPQAVQDYKAWLDSHHRSLVATVGVAIASAAASGGGNIRQTGVNAVIAGVSAAAAYVFGARPDFEKEFEAVMRLPETQQWLRSLGPLTGGTFAGFHLTGGSMAGYFGAVDAAETRARHAIADCTTSVGVQYYPY